jgi:hypothetical protein
LVVIHFEGDHGAGGGCGQLGAGRGAEDDRIVDHAVVDGEDRWKRADGHPDAADLAGREQPAGLVLLQQLQAFVGDHDHHVASHGSNRSRADGPGLRRHRARDVAGHVDFTVCSGPSADHEACPLVMDGQCPLGEFDAVVSALEGPWATAVRRAWAQSTTPIVDGSTCTEDDPTARLGHHVGAALQALWPSARE